MSNSFFKACSSYECIKISIIKKIILMNIVTGYIHIHEKCFHKEYFMENVTSEVILCI